MCCPHQDVSSRAPVWGASFIRGRLRFTDDVSSRAPVWGASRGVGMRLRKRKVSSRAPVWGASCEEYTEAAGFNVSSRAPVWGASHPRRRSELRTLRFKSCPRVGGIPCAAGRKPPQARFQVVPPCGGHPVAVISTSSSTLVSSRAPVWGASWQTGLYLPYAMFQVVPPCGGHLYRAVRCKSY